MVSDGACIQKLLKAGYSLNKTPWVTARSTDCSANRVVARSAFLQAGGGRAGQSRAGCGCVAGGVCKRRS